MLTIPMLAARLFQKILQIIARWIENAPATFLLGLIALVLVLVVTTLLSFGLGWSALLDALNVSPKVTVVDSRTLVGSVKPLGQVVTVSYQLATADTHVQINRAILNSCQQAADYAYVVEIQAGTDLTKLDESKILYDADSDTFTITLPQPNLTSCNVYENFSRYKTFMPSDFSTCTRYNDNVFQVLGEFQVIHSMREQAINNGILEDAKRENDQTLTTFLGTIADAKVNIQYEEGDPVHDVSCTPVIPNGWNYTVEDNGNSFWSPK